METLKRSLALSLAFCLAASPLTAGELKTVAVETPLVQPAALRPIAIPQLNAALSVAAEQPLKTELASVQQLPRESAVPQAVAQTPWRERIAALGQRFAEIAGFKGEGDQLAGLRGFFDLGLKPALATDGGYAPSVGWNQSSVLMMKAESAPYGSGRGAPPAPKPSIDRRLASDMQSGSSKLLRATTLNAVVATVAAAVALAAGAHEVSALVLALLPIATTMISDALRGKALLKFAAAGFPNLFSAQKLAAGSSTVSKLGALASMDVGGTLALKLMHAAPLAAAALSAAVLTGWAVWRLSKKFAETASLRKAALYGELKQGEPRTPIDELPGATALEKHGRYFSGGNPVAKFWTTYHYVRMQGLSVFGSLTTAASWHLFFSGKTQKNMTPEEKARFRPGRFDNYIPNFADAQGPTNTRIFAMQDVPDGPKRGDVDMREFERIFRDFAPGGDYVTMKDLMRLWQANAARDDAKGLKRVVGKIAFKKRFKQLLTILADRVVEEDGKLVPAISRDGLLRYYQGGAAYDLLRERGGK